jgi:hypothetical protein
MACLERFSSLIKPHFRRQRIVNESAYFFLFDLQALLSVELCRSTASIKNCSRF